MATIKNSVTTAQLDSAIDNMEVVKVYESDGVTFKNFKSSKINIQDNGVSLMGFLLVDTISISASAPTQAIEDACNLLDVNSSDSEDKAVIKSYISELTFIPTSIN